MSVATDSNKESVDVGAFFDRLKRFDGFVAQARKLDLLKNALILATLKKIAYNLQDELTALNSQVHAYANHKFIGLFDIRGSTLRRSEGSIEEVITGKRPTRMLSLGRTTSSDPIIPPTIERLGEKGRWRKI